MPFKSDKQRKWMHANEPDMAKKWEKEESLREKIRGIIKGKLEATTTSAVPPENIPMAFKKSTQKAIDIDDEDDEKNESTKEYGKTLDKIAKDRQLKSISKKDRDILIKIAKLMKRANESVNEGRKWTMYVDDKKIKTHASKRAAVIAYNKFIKDTDDWKEVSIQAESVNEATSSKDFFSGNKVTNSLPRATLSLLNSKLNKASEAIIKITDKYKKQGDIDELVKIWMRGLHLRLKKGGIKIESVNEARRVGYDKSYLDNAKKKLKVSHEITDIEYKKTRQHDKFVKISYKLKWKPGTRLDTEEKDVSVFYDSPERLKMIGKTLKLKLKESVNEKVAKPFSEHLRKAQDEIEYMISNGPTPDGDDGVYDRPNQAMKLLQIAQKSLGKIK